MANGVGRLADRAGVPPPRGGRLRRSPPHGPQLHRAGHRPVQPAAGEGRSRRVVARRGPGVVERDLGRAAAAAQPERRRVLSAAPGAFPRVLPRGDALVSGRALDPGGLGHAAARARHGEIARRGVGRRRQLRVLGRSGLRGLLLQLSSGRRAASLVAVGAGEAGPGAARAGSAHRRRLRTDAPGRRRLLAVDRARVRRALDRARSETGRASRARRAAARRTGAGRPPRPASGPGDGARGAGDPPHGQRVPSPGGAEFFGSSRAASGAGGPVPLRPGVVDGPVVGLGSHRVPPVLRDVVRRADRPDRPGSELSRGAARPPIRPRPDRLVCGAGSGRQRRAGGVGEPGLAGAPAVSGEVHAGRRPGDVAGRRDRGRRAPPGTVRSGRGVRGRRSSGARRRRREPRPGGRGALRDRVGLGAGRLPGAGRHGAARRAVRGRPSLGRDRARHLAAARGEPAAAGRGGRSADGRAGGRKPRNRAGGARGCGVSADGLRPGDREEGSAGELPGPG